MATGGVLGNGTKVAYSIDSPVDWQEVGQLMDISKFIELIPDDVDTTVHSTSNLKTSMPGMISPPEIQVELLGDLDPATSPTHGSLYGYQRDMTVLYWRVEVPTNRTQTEFMGFEFRGYVKSWSPKVPIADKQTESVTIRYAGGYWKDQAVGASQIG